MTIIDPARAALRDLCGGAVALPGDDGYDAARQGFNLAVDQRPAAVAYPADADEVAEVVARRARRRPARRAPGDRPQRGPARRASSRTVLLKTSGHGRRRDRRRRAGSPASAPACCGRTSSTPPRRTA